MPITPVNRAKNSITPTNTTVKTLVVWADALITWADPIGLWGSGYRALTNRTKNNITPVNRVKN